MKIRLTKEERHQLKESLKTHIKQHGKKEVLHAFRYLILSTLWAIVDCVIFLTLTSLSLPIIPSNIISDFWWMVTSFSLNLKRNFKHNDHIKMRFISYITISLTWMILSTWMVYFFIKWLDMPKAVAKTLQILIMAIPLYIANRLITFKNFKPKTI
jgi:putative flippase GtrA